MLNSLVYGSLTCVLIFFLNNGMMFASFHSNGTTPSSSDKLKTVASGMLTLGVKCRALVVVRPFGLMVIVLIT